MDKITCKQSCCKCQKFFKTREMLCCASCKKYYDINCAQVSSTRFYIMEKSKKDSWKCHTCYNTKAKSKITVTSCADTSVDTNTPLSHVTHRRIRNKPIPVTPLTPLHKSEEDQQTSSDDDLHSLPDITTLQNEGELELLNEISKLKLELEKAHNEIENLNLENSELKRKVTEKETLTVKWKKLFTEAMSTPKRRGSFSRRDASDKKSTRKLLPGRSLENDTIVNQDCTKTLTFSKDISDSNVCQDIPKFIKTVKDIPLEKKRVASNVLKKQVTINNNINNKEVDITANKKKVLVFSDSIGQGLASKIADKSDSQILNNCKPDAGFQIILENYGTMTENLAEEDLMLILLTKYESSLDNNKQTYLKLLNKIIKNPKRKFNVLITGLRYNGKHDNDIYYINEQIANMANVNENVKYLDPNTRHNNAKINNYKSLKSFITDNVIRCINQFHGSSSLRFIRCKHQQSVTRDQDTNFPMAQEKIQER